MNREHQKPNGSSAMILSGVCGSLLRRNFDVACSMCARCESNSGRPCHASHQSARPYLPVSCRAMPFRRDTSSMCNRGVIASAMRIFLAYIAAAAPSSPRQQARYRARRGCAKCNSRFAQSMCCANASRMYTCRAALELPLPATLTGDEARLEQQGPADWRAFCF